MHLTLTGGRVFEFLKTGWDNQVRVELKGLKSCPSDVGGTCSCRSQLYELYTRLGVVCVMFARRHADAPRSRRCSTKLRNCEGAIVESRSALDQNTSWNIVEIPPVKILVKQIV